MVSSDMLHVYALARKIVDCLHGLENIVDLLRVKTVPYGYMYHSWIPGMH